MEKNQPQISEEIKKNNRRFLANAGVIFLGILIGSLWLINLFHLFQKDFQTINEQPKKEQVDFDQVRNDLNKVMTNVGEKFEKIKDQKAEIGEAEVLLEKINSSASSSLLTATSSTSSNVTTSVNILKK